jgi:hypothetical protein
MVRIAVYRGYIGVSASLAIWSSTAMAQGNGISEHAANALGGAVTGAAVAALVGGIGWIIAYVLNSQREDRTKRLQLTIEHTSNQLRDFYAPLVALTEQLDTLAQIKEEIIKEKSPEVIYDLTGTFYENFFLPIHTEINSILKIKVHLLEGASTPHSFVSYFEHYAGERAYWQLARMGKDVSRMHVSAYPSEFYYDVRRGYQTVLDRYEASLAELRQSSTSRLLGLHLGGRDRTDA